MSRILYRLIARLAGLAVRSGRSKDLELIALRHQLGVLHRQIDRPEIDDDDRTLLGAIAAGLPRRCYVLFFIHVPTRQVFYAGATANPTGHRPHRSSISNHHSGPKRRHQQSNATSGS